MRGAMNQRHDTGPVPPPRQGGPGRLHAHGYLTNHAALILLALAVAPLPRPPALVAQQVVTTGGWQEATPGSELERYLRVLQLAGETPLYPWSVRGFSPEEIDHLAPRDTRHPWARWLRPPAPRGPPGLEVAVLRPDVGVVYNSSFPWAHSDGVVWAGRGVTGVVQMGIQARYGPLSLTLDPILFSAQNQAFALVPNGVAGAGQYRDATTPNTIDYPQRFGATPYSRIDPGQSTLWLEAFGLEAGVSTAQQLWGPGITQQLVLSNAGPGYLHVFVGTSRPLDLWIGHLHGRIETGKLEQSAYSPMPPAQGTRLMSGAVITFVPRWTPGLEVGLARFFEQFWQGWHLSDLLIPFQGFLSTQINLARKYDPNSPDYAPQHQTASVFARWAFPASGFELFGEFARDDRNYNLRDLLGEPDHISGYLLGFMKTVRRMDGNLVAFRAEIVNGRTTDLARVRGEAPFYVHTPILQGNTNRGIILGSPLLAAGGSGEVLGMDRYQPDGRWTVEASRAAYPVAPYQEGAPTGGWNVDYALRVERLLFLHGWDLTAAVTGVYELNHNFARDAFNLRLDLGTRVGLDWLK